MQAKVIKELFEQGAISEVCISPEPMSKGWVLQFFMAKGKHTLLETARGGVRVFSALETAVTAVEEITGRRPRHFIVGI